MTATIIAFPGVDVGSIRARPTCLADLPEGAKALVIEADRGRFMVSVQPAPNEQRGRWTFASPEEARGFARSTSIARPRLFQLIIDRIPERRMTLDELLGAAPGDGGHAA